MSWRLSVWKITKLLQNLISQSSSQEIIRRIDDLNIFWDFGQGMDEIIFYMFEMLLVNGLEKVKVCTSSVFHLVQECNNKSNIWQ